jgi:hypothetical protein
LKKIILIKGRNPKNKLFKEIFFCRFLEDFLQFDIYYMKVIVKIQRKIKKKNYEVEHIEKPIYYYGTGALFVSKSTSSFS